MVLLVKGPRGINLTHWIEEVFTRRHKLSKKPFHTYYTASKLADALGLTEQALFRKLQNSKNLHGILYRDVLYIHPDIVIKMITRHVQRQIDKELFH